MKEINCPNCQRKLGVLKPEVESAQGTIFCPFCQKSFGWNTYNNPGGIAYLWSD